MPLTYARSLTGRARTPQANRQLGCALAFVAGATNAGGFLAVQTYTSHMTGIVSSLARDIGIGAYALVATGLGAVVSFLLGAATCAILVNHSRRRNRHSEYALPLLLEAFLLICFGLLGARLSNVETFFVPATVMLLCFIMGLQNALITKISKAEIRTTHVTGIVTDLGIELGKLIYWNRSGPSAGPAVRADRQRLKILASLLSCFFMGSLLGALGFERVGYVSIVPIALVLVGLASVPAFDDLSHLLRARAKR